MSFSLQPLEGKSTQIIFWNLPNCLFASTDSLKGIQGSLSLSPVWKQDLQGFHFSRVWQWHRCKNRPKGYFLFYFSKMSFLSIDSKTRIVFILLKKNTITILCHDSKIYFQCFFFVLSFPVGLPLKHANKKKNKIKCCLEK